MRRRRRLRVVDIPRLLIGGADQLAGLFLGRYARSEGAHVLARDDVGRILVVRTTYMGPEWMLPGGRVERGETPQTAAARETLEETGLRIVVDRLLLVDARDGNNTSFGFGGHVVGGTMAPQFGEIAEVGWVERQEIRRTARPLESLLRRIDTSGESVAYVGLPHGDRSS